MIETSEIIASKISSSKDKEFSLQGLAMRCCMDVKSDDLYFFGGHDADGPSRGELSLSFTKFNLKSLKWETLSTPPQGRLYPTVAFDDIDRKIYIWGGKKRNDYTEFGTDFVIYDVDEDTWKEVLPEDFRVMNESSSYGNVTESSFSLLKIDSPHVVSKFLNSPLHNDKRFLCIFGWTDGGEISQRCLVDFEKMEMFSKLAPPISETESYYACCFGEIIEDLYYNIFCNEESDEGENTPTAPLLCRINLLDLKTWEIIEGQVDTPWGATQLSHLKVLGTHRLFLWGGSQQNEDALRGNGPGDRLDVSTFHLNTRIWSKVIVKPSKEDLFHVQRVGEAVVVTRGRILLMGGLAEEQEEIERDIFEIDLTKLYEDEILLIGLEEKDNRGRVAFLFDLILSYNECEDDKDRLGMETLILRFQNTQMTVFNLFLFQ